jgi:hypothetical protein
VQQGGWALLRKKLGLLVLDVGPIVHKIKKKWEVIPLAHEISTQALYIFAVDGEVRHVLNVLQNQMGKREPGACFFSWAMLPFKSE